MKYEFDLTDDQLQALKILGFEPMESQTDTGIDNQNQKIVNISYNQYFTGKRDKWFRRKATRYENPLRGDILRNLEDIKAGRPYNPRRPNPDAPLLENPMRIWHIL